MHELVGKLFWLQVDFDFALYLRWVPSAENAEADKLTRPESWEYIRLSQPRFDEPWAEWGGFDLDLMASSVSVQCPPQPVEGRAEMISRSIPDSGRRAPLE